MPKKPNLAAALNDASKKPNRSQVSKKIEPLENSDNDANDKIPPSRRGKKAITVHFDPAACKQLKQLAMDEETSIQALMTEALNDLFEKYGKNPIA
ncbi:hypothetical protein DSM106972_095210 [Dulcicalothrix desertica PCC 7102]|uniref:Antitoxin-like ribbon-helix-helix domain-containing protein n=1 Tax=Dulcicalothrix desertica PCC 7102 TaxID=232991 RepID=A0A3S5K2U9_9CYAN|nr:ribbon-helix-helix domain-containing protein [Dulcicalothrix desertica]RUS93922.1 hypothetical protein DSM106972_095210 [Dulcicalothrix desertica PCC 7102]TWH61610.1 hypothetical protein CAL7102_00834 [Dulcicalothrix desertica PCC 7102]